MEILHPWHDHSLILSDEVKFEERCSICKKRFEGDPFYACLDCKFYVHESRVEIQHHFHPQHPLALSLGYHFFCDSCHKRFPSGELRFRCSDCDFQLDVKCATMSDIDKEGKEFIRHFSHQHPLTICSKDGDQTLTCFACKKTSSDLIFGCSPCDYFLHKSCSEISIHVLHAMHPQHVLSLAVNYDYCDYCRHLDHTWKYCHCCGYRLDVSCLMESAKDPRNLETSCFLCNKQHLDSDSCIDFLYLINQSCIQLPETIEHQFHSHKPLSLLGAKDFECDSCHQWILWQSFYGCKECNFQMEVRCAIMRSIQYDSNESIWPIIPPHFNHQHPLRLFGEVYSINCSACHTTKLSPIYGCFKCDYFLHRSCLELPSQINQPLHDIHVLSLQPLRDNFCRICGRKYDGFGYGCINCRFFIGIECIFEPLPSVTIVHKYHHHFLYLIERSYWNLCNAENAFCQYSGDLSEFKLSKSYSLRCIECEYNVHLLCGPLPCTIKHKSHVHVLTLEDSIVEDDSDEHYCDVCEELRNPRLSVYYCEDCRFFAHVHCVISEIINVFKKNSNKVELRIVGDFILEDTANPSYNISSQERLLDLLKCLDVDDLNWFKLCFPHRDLFPSLEDPWKSDKQKSSSNDDTMNIEEEFSFYNDDISYSIMDRLESFKPSMKYHIEFDECELSN